MVSVLVGVCDPKVEICRPNWYDAACKWQKSLTDDYRGRVKGGVDFKPLGRSTEMINIR